MSVDVQGGRIYVGDAQVSVGWVLERCRGGRGRGDVFVDRTGLQEERVAGRILTCHRAPMRPCIDNHNAPSLFGYHTSHPPLASRTQ